MPCYESGVNLTRAPLALLAGLALVDALVSISACGSKAGSSGDAGPQCEPACPDAGDASDAIAFADMGLDAAPTCASVCVKGSDVKGCPDPGCETQCARNYQTCEMLGQAGAFQALLACLAKASYTCESGEGGAVPVAAACAKEVATVAAVCQPKEASADVIPCSMMAGQAECISCCQTMNFEGAQTYNVAVTSCTCDSPGLCSSACATSECAGTMPAAGSACQKCLDKVLGPDGGCEPTVASACGSDPSCVAYEMCLQTNACASMK